MTNTEIFNKMIELESDSDKKAKLEICREYFTNPEFKAALEQMTWEINNGK